MKDRFDLEEEITKLFSFVDDIQAVVEYLSETDIDPRIIDNVSNILLGTSTLLGLHADKMLDTMCQCFKIDEYSEEQPRKCGGHCSKIGSVECTVPNPSEEVPS